MENKLLDIDELLKSIIITIIPNEDKGVQLEVNLNNLEALEAIYYLQNIIEQIQSDLNKNVKRTIN